MIYHLVDTQDRSYARRRSSYTTEDREELIRHINKGVHEYGEPVGRYEIVDADTWRAEVTARYARAAKDALQVQDACNLIGVLNSFHDAVQDIWSYLNAEGRTHELRTDPVLILWLDKIVDMMARVFWGSSGSDSFDSDYYGKATRACEAIVAEAAATKEKAA